MAWRESAMAADDLAAAIGRHLTELVAAMTAKGYDEASVGVVVSATPASPVVVGLYLRPTRADTLSAVDVAFTAGSLAWARREIARLPDRHAPATQVA